MKQCFPVPSSGPIDVSANATSSTTVVVLWGQIPPQDQNGLIEGYKVCYAAVVPPPRPEQKKVECHHIPSNQTHTVTLTELRKYVVYQIQVLGYTRLGDGALSDPPVTVRTFEDSKLTFVHRILLALFFKYVCIYFTVTNLLRCYYCS